MEHDVVLIEDEFVYIRNLKKLLEEYSDGGIGFNPIPIVPVRQDPRVAVKMVSEVLWPRGASNGSDAAMPRQPLIVILDLNFKFDVPGEPDQWLHGLRVVYQGMIDEWRRHGGGARPWRHIYARSRVASIGTDATKSAVRIELEKYHVPEKEGHFVATPITALHQSDHELVEKIAVLARKYEAGVASEGADRVVCGCLKEPHEYP